MNLRRMIKILIHSMGPILLVSGILLAGSETFMPYSQLIGVTCFALSLPCMKGLKL